MGEALFLTPSDVISWVFCRRHVFFHRCLGIPEYQENRFKVQAGRKVHAAREVRKPGTRRSRLKARVIAVDLHLEAPILGLRGVVDELLELEHDESLAPLEFKFTPERDFVYRTHRTQLLLYADLIEECYQRPVRRGWIAYVRGGNKTREVDLAPERRASSRMALEETGELIRSCRFPARAPNPNHCNSCGYGKICPDGP
jgi:CRISPR-associated exonuclease Cas4